MWETLYFKVTKVAVCPLLKKLRFLIPSQTEGHTWLMWCSICLTRNQKPEFFKKRDFNAGSSLPKCGTAEKLKWGNKVSLKLATSENKKDRENSWNYWSLQPGKVWWACSLFPPSLFFYFPSLSCRWQFLTSLPLEGQRKKGVGWVREDSSYLLAAGAIMETHWLYQRPSRAERQGKYLASPHQHLHLSVAPLTNRTQVGSRWYGSLGK